MKKIISILLTASMLAGSAATPFTAIAAETATTASQASEAEKSTMTTDINSTIKDLGVFEEGEKMTIDDVIELSKKGNSLTLNDFSKFKGVIAGSGIFILEYDLGKGYTLMVGSVALDKIDYARLRYSNSENYVDIRTDDVETFLKETSGDTNANTYKVKVTVTEVNGDNLIVKPEEDSQAYKVSDKFAIPTKYLGSKVAPVIGMMLEVTYAKDFQTSYPAKFSEIKDVSVFKTFTVLDIYDTYVIVRSDFSRFTDILFLYKKYIGSDIDPVPGMKLTFGYTGTLDTYPGQFGGVHDVKVVSENAGLIKGDSNCDSQVNMADVVLIMQALANPNRFGEKAEDYTGITELGVLNGDMNGDGLTVGDAQAIQRKLLGLDSESIEIKPELGDIVSIKTPYRPAMSDWSGIGILLEFDSKDYSITLSTNEGHFTTWDIETGDGVVTNVGKTYDVGNSGYIFWTPDDLKYSDDFENEITVKGKNGDAQIELGKIYVTKDNQSNKSDLIASLERKRTMTLYDVKELAKKDGEFTWADFEAYSGRKCGTPFDMLAYIYEIDESYYLFVSGAVDGAPDQVQLCHYNEHISVDVLTGDVEAFIAEYSDYELPDIGYTFDEIYNMTEDEVRTVFNEKGLTDTEKYHVYPQRNGNTAVDNNSMTVLLYPENYMINLTDHELVTHVTNINDQDKLFKNSDIIWDREKVRKSLGLPKEYFYFEDVSSMGVTKSVPEGEDPDIRKYCQCSIRCTSEDKDKIADLRRAALNYIQLNPDFALVYPETYGG